MKPKIDQEIVQKHNTLCALANHACILNPTTSRYEHDCFIKEAREFIKPGSLGMISDDYTYLGNGYGAYQPGGNIERITELTRQGDEYFSLEHNPAKKGDHWLGQLASRVEIFSDKDIGERVSTLIRYFETDQFHIVPIWHRRNERNMTTSGPKRAI